MSKNRGQSLTRAIQPNRGKKERNFNNKKGPQVVVSGTVKAVKFFQRMPGKTIMHTKVK